MSTILLLALAAAGVGGATTLGRAPAGTPGPSPSATASARAVPSEQEAAVIEGAVLEVLQVKSYTYLRLSSEGREETWVAVTKAEVAPGANVRVRDATRMTAFTSTTLNRTFATIYFGTLEGEPAKREDAPHAPLGAVPVKPVARALGPEARTVEEVVTHRIELAGKRVRVRATVVKATPGVLGRTYVHVRDGSGEPSAGTHDLTVTTESEPVVGETVTIEGVVAVDRDLGAGYKFATIVDDAKLTPSP